ncbi:hypothetical protein [Streptomyces sp. NPDC088789]|uniref:hypothetical protein n=1 Tax=Streptomyces sp. NPDC088789 TaxID=3365899 RepID=UPI00382DDD9F
MDRDLHLHLPIVWPYLWTALPEPTRNELTSTRTALTKATTLTLWSWPALPITTGIALAGWRNTRTTTDTYAQLLEATTRLHLTTLATQLGIPTPVPPPPPSATPSPTTSTPNPQHPTLTDNHEHPSPRRRPGHRRPGSPT